MTVCDAISHIKGVKDFVFDTHKTEYPQAQALRIAWDLGILNDEVASLSFGVGSGGIVCAISTVYKEVEANGS